MADPVGVSVALGASGPLAVSPTWTQLDLTDNLVSSYSVRRGRTDQFQRTGTGTAEIQLVDQTGLFDPTSANYLGETTGKPAALSLHNPVTDAWTCIFYGLIDAVECGMAPAQNYSAVTISLVDTLDYLANTELIPDLDISGFPPPETPAYAIPRLGFIYFPETDPGGTTGTVADDINTVLSRAEVGWPDPELRSIFTGNVRATARSYSVGTTALTVIDDLCDAEFPGIANRWISKKTVNTEPGAFVFHGRLARFDPTDPSYDIEFWKAGDGAAITGSSDYAQIRGLTFGRARADLVNSALFTYQAIADVAIPEMLVEDSTSITAYGRRTKSADNLRLKFSVLTGNDAHDECILFGNYWVTVFKDPQTRIRQLVFRSLAPSDPRAAKVWALMCGVEISDIITVNVTGPGVGGFEDVDYFVEGITYQVDPLQPTFQNVTLTLDLSPRAWYDFEWVPA